MVHTELRFANESSARIKANSAAAALVQMQQRAAVAHVCQRAAEHGENGDRDNARQPHAAQAQRLGIEAQVKAKEIQRHRRAVEQLEDVPVDRHQLHLRADNGDELADPDQAKITVLEGDKTLVVKT